MIDFGGTERAAISGARQEDKKYFTAEIAEGAEKQFPYKCFSAFFALSAVTTFFCDLPS